MLDTLPNLVLQESDPYSGHFARLEQAEAASAPVWLHAVRKSGLAYAAELGFPDSAQEEWRFTNVAPIAQLPFRPVLANRHHGLTIAGLKRFFLDTPSCHRLVFVDGHYAPALSSAGQMPQGLNAGSLAGALSMDAELVKPYLTRCVHPGENIFAALNTAFFQDGACIFVPAGMAMSEPIHLLFVAATAETGARFHPRNLIVAQRHSMVIVIETYVPITGAAYCTNTVTELVLGEGATVEHCRVQNESQGAFHIAAVQAHQGRGSRFISHSISLGARLARQDIRSVLDGEWSDCLMNGLYLGEAGQLVDHHTVMDHSKPRCASNEHYHGILAGRAQGVFNGKILVRQEAQKTAAKQTNRNVLLSDEAVINTKPQLEIFADDVKCAHGATVGQLDEEAIFYLQSRGLGADQARLMLLRAFASQILDRVQCEPARAQIEQHVWDRLQTMV